MKKTYVKPGLKRNLKLVRTAPVNPLVTQGGIRAEMKRGLYNRAKQTPRKASNHLIRTLDTHREEEAHEAVQSLLLPKKGVDQVKQGYSKLSKFSKAVNRISGRPSAIKSSSRSRQLYGFRKIKGAGSAQPATHVANMAKIKTLGSKFVSKNKFSSLTIKTGIKKALSSPSAFLKAAAQQLARKLIAAAATVSAKVWLIAAAIAVVFFLIMSVTNSAGGAASSAGSFFMTDEENAKHYKETVDTLNAKWQQQIEDYKDSGYDQVTFDYMNEDGVLQVSWVEIFALVAVQFEQDLTFSDKQKNYMETLFHQFNRVNTTTKTYTVEVCSITVDPKTKKEERQCHFESRTRLVVKIYSYDMEDVFEKIGFTEEQREWARRLVTSGAIQEQFPELGGGGYAGGTSPNPGSLTPEEMADLLNNLGGDIDKARRKLIETAITLEGKVEYFWGGKSPAGWNSNWGELVMVTAPGNDNTGTLQPYGLDCSGFIDWSFKTAGLGKSFSAGGTAYQWNKTYAISKDELTPGDLVFKNIPGQGGVNHVGIFIGRDTKGNPLYVHCQGSTGVIINSYKGFKYPRRPLLFQ